jgi:FdhD protein
MGRFACGVEIMLEQTENFKSLRIVDDERIETEETVVRESALTIIFNGKELVTLLCSPSDLKELAVGFLLSEGLIASKADIKRISLDARIGIARVNTESGEEPSPDMMFKRMITSGCCRGSIYYTAADAQNIRPIESKMTLSAKHISGMMNEFQHRSEVYLATGGVHSAALCDGNGILLFAEDIGRHNAIDKIFGHCLLNGINADEYAIMTSGRVSSEILFKVLKRNIPIILSKSAPTASGVKLANDAGITLVGFIRGNRMNVYTNAWRVTTSASMTG